MKNIIDNSLFLEMKSIDKALEERRKQYKKAHTIQEKSTYCGELRSKNELQLAIETAIYTQTRYTWFTSGKFKKKYYLIVSGPNAVGMSSYLKNMRLATSEEIGYLIRSYRLRAIRLKLKET